MYCRIFIKNINLTKNSAIFTQVPRYYSQQISLAKSSVTNVFQGLRKKPLCGVSNISIFRLSSNACKRNGKICSGRQMHSTGTEENSQINAFDVNTNIVNNVFLFKYEKPRFFTFIKIFAIFQCVFWVGMGYSFYREIPAYDSNTKKLKTYINDNFIFLLVSYGTIFLGISSALLLWVFVTRSVRFIILKKGGQDVTFVTYHPFPKKSSFTVPLTHVSCRTPRTEMKYYMPVKIKNRRFFYIMDHGGEFFNPKLYDYTIGLSRNF